MVIAHDQIRTAEDGQHVVKAQRGETLLEAARLIGLVVAGASLGAALGALKGRSTRWAIIGALVSPLAIVALIIFAGIKP
jgi:hypothetical protein